MKIMRCYNCSCEINEMNKTREHIPAQTLFAGYGDEYKINRITVPACRSCNDSYSKTDEIIRDIIGITNNDNISNIEITKKAVKGILRKSNWQDRLYTNPNGIVQSVHFQYEDMKKYFIKDFKGIFFKEFGYPISDDFAIQIVADCDTGMSESLDIATIVFFQYTDKDTEWKISGHEDIFRYKLKCANEGYNGKLYNGDIDSAIMICSILEYHKNINCLVIATKKKILENKIFLDIN